MHAYIHAYMHAYMQKYIHTYTDGVASFVAQGYSNPGKNPVPQKPAEGLGSLGFSPKPSTLNPKISSRSLLVRMAVSMATVPQAEAVAWDTGWVGRGVAVLRVEGEPIVATVSFKEV